MSGKTWWVVGLATAVVALLAMLAPYLYAEVEFNLLGHAPTLEPKPTGPVAGRWVDDYFVVQPIDASTFAIGEPRYYQANYSYLIVGSTRAILFDAGTGTRDIVPVVRSLTALPVTVIPSHLHFDHVGALGRLDKTALLGLPSLLGRVRNSRLTLDRYEFMGFADRLKAPTFHVDEWLAPDSVIDLGGRSLRIWSTPGHTPDSVSLYDAQRRQLFVGDFMYPGHLYAFLPGASRSAYLATTRRLLSSIGPATLILTAHMAEPPAPVSAPVLEFADLKALEHALVAIDQWDLDATGIYPRIYPVRGPVSFATGWPWTNR